MSRIGRMPIPIPKGVEVKIEGNRVSVKGPRGQLVQEFDPNISASLKDDEIVVSRSTDQRHHRALHGLTRALLNNMVLGVTKGFRKELEIVGTGYRAEMAGQNMILHLGFSHPVEVVPPPNVAFTVGERARKITVEGIDKAVVGQVAADLRGLRPPEPYKGKGVRYVGEYVRRKAGKAGKIA